MSEPVDKKQLIVPEGNVRALVDQLIGAALEGKGPFSAADDLAAGYLKNNSYSTKHEMVNALIKKEASKNFSSGFLTGLGGVITLPVAVPASIYASWVVQARMAAAIAIIYGYNIKEDRVRTMVLVAIIGDAGREILKKAGVSAAEGVLHEAVKRIPASALREINKTVGFKLIALGSEKGTLSLSKVIPVAGGLIGGILDAVTCIIAGRGAALLFRPAEEEKEYGGKKESFPIMITTRQISDVLKKNSSEIASLSIPKEGVIAVKPTLIPFSIPFTLVSFIEGVIRFKIDGNFLVRKMTEHRLAEVMASLPTEYRRCLYLQNRDIIISLPVLIKEIVGLKGIEVADLQILPEGVGIILK